MRVRIPAMRRVIGKGRDMAGCELVVSCPFRSNLAPFEYKYANLTPFQKHACLPKATIACTLHLALSVYTFR